MTNLMFLLLYCIGFAVLFLIACLLEMLSVRWHERRYQHKRDRYRGHMRDLTSPQRLGHMASYRKCDE